MKTKGIITLFIFITSIIACSAKKGKDRTSSLVLDTTVAAGPVVTDTFETGKVIDHVICKNDAGQSYTLYIPLKDQNRILPVIYFFDPHGNGTLPVNKYKALADKYAFILAGSNNSKNGMDWSTTENIWRALSGDVQTRLNTDKGRMYVCGFSGGAKVAGYVAMNHGEVKGVIANGAGLPDNTAPSDFNFGLTAVAGEGDLNMTDLVAFNSALDKSQTRHRIIFFDGIHEWAPVNTMDIAFASLQLDGMFQKLIPRDDVFISNYARESKKRLDAYLTTNNLVKAERECILSISLLDGLTGEVNVFKEKYNFILQNTEWQKQSREREGLLDYEQNLKTGYRQQFGNMDMIYWTNTIRKLQENSKAKTAEGAMYQRLRAYLSLAFYSLSNQFIAANQNTEAQYFVDLYKLADPANSEAWYFSAIMNARNNKAKAAENDLLKAVALGFADKSRMMQEPDFQKLGTGIDFSTIGGKMR